MKLRDDVLKALEEARNAKVIGKSLNAKVTLYVSEEMEQVLANIHESLEQLFIVSAVEVAGSIQNAPEEAVKLDHAAIIVTKAEGETCERCWNISEEVGQVKEHPLASCTLSASAWSMKLHTSSAVCGKIGAISFTSLIKHS